MEPGNEHRVTVSAGDAAGLFHPEHCMFPELLTTKSTRAQPDVVPKTEPQNSAS